MSDDKPHSPAEVFKIDRVFNAPRDLVWAACTEAQHLSGWFGPPGTTVKVKTLDLKPGEAKDVRLAYRMKWPADREIVFGDAPPASVVR